MFKIGSEEEAGFILFWHLLEKSGRDYYSDEVQPPEGWKRLGSGCYRVAYLSPSGVVYKIQHRYDSIQDAKDWVQSNGKEIRNLRKYHLKKFPKGCRLPRWAEFRFGDKSVVAMERIERTLNALSYNERTSLSARQRKLCNLVTNDIYDTHGGNIGYNKSTDDLIMIDWGG